MAYLPVTSVSLIHGCIHRVTFHTSSHQVNLLFSHQINLLLKELVEIAGMTMIPTVKIISLKWKGIVRLLCIIGHLVCISLMADFKKFVPGNAVEARILSFYDSFWGRPLPIEHATLQDHVGGAPDEVDGDENDGDLLPPQPIIKSSWKDLLIRAEYIRIYEYVARVYKDLERSAIVLTGQPGIGKCSVTDLSNFSRSP
jgi:hypothetical protein